MAIVEKKKIMSLAKEHGVPAEKLVRLLQEQGHQVKSAFSSVDPKVLDSMSDKLDTLKEKSKNKKVGTTPKSGGIQKNSSKSKDEDTSEGSGSRKLMGAKITLKKGTRKKADDSDRSERAKNVFKSSAVKKAKPPVEEKKAEVKSNPLTEAPAAPKKNIGEEAKALFKEPAPQQETPREEKPVVKQEGKASAPKVDNSSSNEEKPLAVAANKKSEEELAAQSQGQLKVKVEAPTAELAARIAKYKSGPAGGNRGPRGGGNRGPRGGGNRGGDGIGYTGKFSQSVSGGRQGGPGQGAGNQGGGPNRGGAPRPGGNQGGGQGRGPQQRNNNQPKNNSMAHAFNQNAAATGGTPPPGMASGKPGAAQNRRGDKGKKKKKHEKVVKERQVDVRQNVSRVMASLSKTPTKKVYRKSHEEGEQIEERKLLKVGDFVTLNELAGLMDEMPNKVMAKCMELGMMVTINHRVDFETIQMIADEFGFEAELMEEYDEEVDVEETENEEDLVGRPPVVTVMGHVDHGKTSLLDWIRSERVASGEAGGITQHMGAYVVHTKQGDITFLDTPGHEAFTAMRARGSQITDVVVLVVAADDRVMPQTIESIEHARAAKVPIVVAINKVDKETANPDKIRSQLAENGIEVEQWGGNVSCIEVSAKTGLGMDELLETLALETEVLQLRANPEAKARGVVIESKLDKGKGAIATVLIQNGTLRVGDNFVTGNYAGKVRALLDEFGKKQKEIAPGKPCQIMGMEGAPFSGDKFAVYEDDRTAREIANKRAIAAKERELRTRRHMTLDQLYSDVKDGKHSDLNVIVKADVDGSAEAISAELEKISNKEVTVNVIRKAVGNINESDIMLASASDAIIVAFHLLPAPAVRDMAEAEGVEIRQYRIIYEIIEEFRGVVEGMLKPTFKEEVVGEAEIKQLFKISKVGWVAGCFVTSGAVDQESKMRIYRQGVEIGTGKVRTLKRHQDDVKSVKAGFECGIGIDGFEGMKEDDVLAFFKVVEIQRTLKDVEKENGKAN